MVVLEKMKGEALNVTFVKPKYQHMMNWLFISEKNMTIWEKMLSNTDFYNAAPQVNTGYQSTDGYLLRERILRNGYIAVMIRSLSFVSEIN